MNKLIGGLLVMSLLGRPEFIQADYLAYEFYKSNTAIINYLRKGDIAQSELYNEDEIIDTLISEIGENKRYINVLITEKNNIFNGLNDIMITKAKNKQKVSDEFIREFQNLNCIYMGERGDLESNIELVINKDLNEIQREILHSDTDYEYIISELEKLAQSQNGIIEFLENITNKGRQTLALCC